MSIASLGRNLALAFTAFALAAASPTIQNPIDRAEPAAVAETLDEPSKPNGQSVTLPLPPPTAAVTLDAEGTVVAGAIRIDGASALPPAAFAPVIADHVGRPLSEAGLRNLAAAIADVARTAGYGLATAWIPEQQIVNGVLRVTIDEGRIDAIDARGPAGAVVNRILAPLADGRPVATARLERQLLLAGDLPGVRVGKPKLQRSAGGNILMVQTRHDAVMGRAYLDNLGTNAIGPVRARLTVDFNGLLADDDRLTLSGVVTPIQPEEFGLVRIGYSKGIGTDGTRISADAYYARSEPGGRFAGRELAGESLEAELSLNHPIVRSRAFSLWGDVSIGVRDSRQDLAGLPIRQDRISMAAAGAYAVARFGQDRLRTRVRLVQGVDLFDPTRAADPVASRNDGSALFTKIEAWGDYLASLGPRFSLLLAAQGQLASRPLLSSEEMGLGGRSFLRGYDYREYSGDKGLAGSAELRFDLDKLPKPARRVQLYGFVDAGSVGNYRDGRGGGSLASAGGGLRAWLGRSVELGAEIGFPLSDRNNFARDRDPRLSLTAAARF